MLFIIFCGLLALASGEEEVTAMSFISRNSNPPDGIDTLVVGTVTLRQLGFDNPTTMDVQISGLPPNTAHGFRIHENGDTVTDGCQSTGGHYNPLNKTHGVPSDQIRHVGDLGNLVSDDQGQVNVTIEDRLVSLVGPYSVIGRAFAIHQKRDDLGQGFGDAEPRSLKTGNPGPRLGCGAIFHVPSN